MSAQLLTDYCRTLNLKSNRPVSFNTTTGLRTEVWEIPSHRWEIEYESIEIQGFQNQRAMMAFLDSLQRGVQTFNWQLPLHGEPGGVADVNADLVLNADSGDDGVAISTTGTSDHNNYLKIGDLVKFSNHSKVYMVSDYTTNTTTEAVVKLNCPLQKPLTVGVTTMQVRNVQMLLMLKPDSDLLTFGRSAGNLDAGFEAMFIEKL